MAQYLDSSTSRAGAPGTSGRLEVRRWYVGDGHDPGEADGVVALTHNALLAGQRRGALSVGFHEAMKGGLPQSPEVHVALPVYRGMRLIPVLAWLVAEHLAQPGAAVSWSMARQQGPKSVQAILQSLGWTLDRGREGRIVMLRGSVPDRRASLPVPGQFTSDLGNRHGISLSADYGVFSPDHVDDGTELLLNAALRDSPVADVADIGVGYGALAIGLVLNGIARSAIGTDVDAIALWLAGKNAEGHGVTLDLRLTADPSDAAPTALTISNVPTHIDAKETSRFMEALALRAQHGTVLLVVHASLEAQYSRLLSSAGPLGRHPGGIHVVLEVEGRPEAGQLRRAARNYQAIAVEPELVD